MIEEILTSGHAQGFKSVRAISHMEWMLQDWPGAERFLEYEARLDGVLSGYRDTVVCVYNCTRFDAQTVMDVLRSHPAVMISGGRPLDWLRNPQPTQVPFSGVRKWVRQTHYQEQQNRNTEFRS